MAVATTQWTSRFAFMMAAIGSAVGLGNLWRFPFHDRTKRRSGLRISFTSSVCCTHCLPDS